MSKPMQRRRIGPFEVGAIGFGAMGLSHGYGPAKPQAWGVRVLNQALDLGCDFIDTAAIYGMGHNETLVGEALGHRRGEFVLASKCGLSNGDRWELNNRPEVIRATCEDSLRRLGVEVIDLYYLHRWDKAVPIEEPVGVLADLVREGKIRAVGLSEVSAPTLRRAHAVHPIAALQTEYSPWTRNPEIAVLDACRELGVGFVAFSPVARGFLAGAIRSAADFAEGDMRPRMPRFQGEALEANLALLARFAALAAEAGMTPAQLCLAWLLKKDGNIVPIPGTTNLDHLAENVAAASLPLGDEIAQRLEVLVNDDTVAGPRYAPMMQDMVDTEA